MRSISIYIMEIYRRHSSQERASWRDPWAVALRDEFDFDWVTGVCNGYYYSNAANNTTQPTLPPDRNIVLTYPPRASCTRQSLR